LYLLTVNCWCVSLTDLTLVGCGCVGCLPCRGRFGEVQRCRERSTGREFAAKFIATNEPKDRQDGVHEVDIMLKLRHCRRLVQLYDVFEMKRNMCLVLEMYVIGNPYRNCDKTCKKSCKTCTGLTLAALISTVLCGNLQLAANHSVRSNR